MKARYKFIHRNPDGSFTPMSVRCEVVGQSERTYTIRLLAPNVNGHAWGDVIRVGKGKVTIDREPADCSRAWWHD